METLNALLKKAIIILDDITYTPQVITTDNTKGEIVVKIEMQKGTVRATVNFTIAGFTTTSQVQANVVAALAKVGANTISGDGAQLPSSMTAELVGALKGFPQTTANGVHFSATPKTSNNAAGTLAIILRATKGKLNKAKEITVRGFKTQSDQVTVDKALAKVGASEISGDGAQLPSSMTAELIGALKGFPQTMANGVHFSATPKTPNNAAGTLTITLMATKGSANKDKEFTIRGFQTQAQADQVAVNVALVAIDETTISGDVDKLPSTMDSSSIIALASFPSTTSGVGFSVIIKRHDNAKGELIITLKATKGSVSKDKELIISGFQTQSDQAAVEAALEEIDEETIIGNANKFPSVMDLVSIKALTSFPSTTASGVHFSAITKGNYDDTKGELEITLRAEKGSASEDKTIKISGFKAQVDEDISAAKAILDKIEDATTVNTFQTAAEVTTYANLSNLISKTSLRFNGSKKDLAILRKVTITITAIPVAKTPTSQIVTFTISKSGGPIATSTIIVAGFKTQIEIDGIDPDLIDLEAAMFNIKGTIKGDNSKLASKMTFKLVMALVGFPQNTNGISFSFYGDLNGHDDSRGVLNIILRVTKNSKTRIASLIIHGFKKKG